MFLFIGNIYSNDMKVDSLLEKAQQASSKDEKNIFIDKLKKELAKINKKAREESNAIIEAKKKLPSKPFKEK